MSLKRLKIAPNFYLDEFKCKDGTLVPVEFHSNVFTLVKDLQVIRNYFNKPLIITSAYRTQAHNEKVGGAENSLHLYAKAVDFKVSGISGHHLGMLVLSLMVQGKIQKGGFGVYATRIHYDHRGYFSPYKLI